MPRDGVYQDVLVKGLSAHGRAPGSGSSSVRKRLEVAPKGRRICVFGILDGDGLSHAHLRMAFDDPHPGPLFQWKAYCIENLLARTAWPAAWGSAPDWRDVFDRYVPYVALNRIHVTVREALETLRLHRYQSPDSSRALLTEAEVVEALESDRHRIEGLDIAMRFADEVKAYRLAAHASVDEAHALLNGKWLVRHLAAGVARKSSDVCFQEWCQAVREAGGAPDVKDLWERMTGNAP